MTYDEREYEWLQSFLKVVTWMEQNFGAVEVPAEPEEDKPVEDKHVEDKHVAIPNTKGRVEWPVSWNRLFD